ncbi:predicted protein [Botrytis cinerea T4]|uniref:Uncharacterized protein n=1 Tax=Botryotinia fuckeliana (strain T4) TaxID=999810 RepID=G2XUB0_BOTF4|nr:predicted protein [Botrytis cinerea T4]
MATTPLSAKQILKSAYGGHDIYLFDVFFYAKDRWLEELQGGGCGEIVEPSAGCLSIGAQSHQIPFFTSTKNYWPITKPAYISSLVNNLQWP